jgi:hypothetical protein
MSQVSLRHWGFSAAFSVPRQRSKAALTLEIIPSIGNANSENSGILQLAKMLTTIGVT